MPKFFVTLEDHSFSPRLKLAALWIVSYLLCRLPARDLLKLPDDHIFDAWPNLVSQATGLAQLAHTGIISIVILTVYLPAKWVRKLDVTMATFYFLIILTLGFLAVYQSKFAYLYACALHGIIAVVLFWEGWTWTFTRSELNWSGKSQTDHADVKL